MVKSLVGTIAVGVLMVAGVASHATAQPDNQPMPVELIVVKFSGDPPAGRLAKMVSRGAITLPDQVTGGPTDGSVTFDYGTLGQVSCTFPQQLFDGTEGWRELGNPAGSRGFTYINRNAPGGIAGPCKIVIVKENVIKILTTGTAGLLPPGRPGTNPDASVVLVAGWALPGFHEMKYCALSVKGTRVEAADRYIRDKHAPAPGYCPGRFVDNGDGTVTDNQTGLMWEKKDDNNTGGFHDFDNRYTWAGCCDGDCSPPYEDSLCQPNAAAAAACDAQTGGAVGCGECSAGTCDVDPYGSGAITTIWDWLMQVNAEGGSGFAGRSDWRIPSEDGCNDCWVPFQCPCDPAELETILLEPYSCFPNPCVDSVFNTSCTPGCDISACSCTAWFGYWSSTTYAGGTGGPDDAWGVAFYDGVVGIEGKYKYGYVRAVRGGSPTSSSTTTLASTTTSTTVTTLPPGIDHYSNSGCLPGSGSRSAGEYPFCDEEALVATVEGSTISVTHRNAVYNCCPDDIEVSLIAEGNVLKLIETEILTSPCFCLCCYDVESQIANVGPGAYRVQVWNADQTQMFGEVEVVVE